MKVKSQEVNRCFKFGEKLYHKNAASSKQFGRRGLNRTKNDFIADHVIGKAVEFAFSHFLRENFNIDFLVDMEIWENHHIHDEGNDLSTVYISGQQFSFKYKTDIKGSRSKSKWLIVEDHKINGFNTQIYVTGILTNIPDGKDLENNPYRFKNKDWYVKILGYALNKDLYNKEENKGWFEFQKGERLYSPSILYRLKPMHRNVPIQDFHTFLENVVKEKSYFIGPPLDCNLNYGLPISWLKNTLEDWRKFKNIITQKSEPVS